MCGKVSLGIWASHANHRAEFSRKREAPAPAAKEVLSEVKREQAERPEEDGRTFPAVRAKAWRVGRDAAHGEEEGRTFKSLVPRSWPRSAHTGRRGWKERRLSQSQHRHLPASASNASQTQGIHYELVFCYQPPPCIGVYTERREIKMG